MKKMIVWSGGNKKAGTAKINLVLSTIAFIIGCSSNILMFFKDAGFQISENPIIEHISTGLSFLLLTGWINIFVFELMLMSYRQVKTNKIICLYLYNMNDFAKLTKIPDDKYVLFADETGVVLANKCDSDESNYFAFGAKHFNDFENYYSKHLKHKYLREDETLI